MTIGWKIRRARTEAHMTQAELAGDEITRNMLSLIENGNAEPSLGTLRYLAHRLSLPVSYFLSDDRDAFTNRKAEAITDIRAHLKNGDFGACIQLCAPFSGQEDDELHFILSQCFSGIGQEAWHRHQLRHAEDAWQAALSHAQKTVYDTRLIEAGCKLYLSFVRDLLSELRGEPKEPQSSIRQELFDDLSLAGDLLYFTSLELYAANDDFAVRRFLASGQIRNSVQKAHLNALLLRREGALREAVSCFDGIDFSEGDPVTLTRAYRDLEEMHTAMEDFDAAYRYHLLREKVLASLKTTEK